MHGRLSRVLDPGTNASTSIWTGLGGISRPSYLFDPPVVAEVVGAGFVHPSNAQYLSIRFPPILKLHTDRSVHDVVSFSEYQSLAHASTRLGDPQSEYRSWPCQLDVDSDDGAEQAAVPLRGDQSQEEVTELVVDQNMSHVGAGAKRSDANDDDPVLFEPTKLHEESSSPYVVTVFVVES